MLPVNISSHVGDTVRQVYKLSATVYQIHGKKGVLKFQTNLHKINMRKSTMKIMFLALKKCETPFMICYLLTLQVILLHSKYIVYLSFNYS